MKRTVHVNSHFFQSAAVALVTVGGSAVAAWCVANDAIWHLPVAECHCQSMDLYIPVYRGPWPETPTTVPCGAAENAGVENAAPDCRGGKRGSNEYGKPKFPLFNIVTSALQQPIELI